MLVAIVGNPKQLIGNGKTLYLTWLLTKGYLGNLPINANYHLFEPLKYNHINGFADLEKCKFSLIGLDEFWIWCDSRRALTPGNIKFSTKMLQSRKTVNHIVYSVQDFSQIDKRIRNITELFIMVEMLHKEKLPENKMNIQLGVKYIDKTPKILRDFTIQLGAYANLYDTNEIIEEPIELLEEDK